MSKEFVAFVITGGFAAGVNWISGMILHQFMALEIAVVIAYIIGMITAYTLSRIFVFEKSGRSVWDEFIRFTLVNMVALVQVWLVTMALVRFVFPAIDWTWFAPEIAHGIGVASPVITSYLGHRFFTFSQAPPKAEFEEGVSRDV